MDIQKYYMIYSVYNCNFPYKANKINENNFDKSYDYSLNSFEWVPYNLGIIIYLIMIIIS